MTTQTFDDAIPPTERPGPGAGIHTISLADYLADPCPSPSLNASIAALLAKRSPAHAFAAHPRLGSAPGDTSEAQWKGSLLHNLVLEHGDRVFAIELDDLDKNGNMTTKAAKDLKSGAEASGLLPVSRPKLDEAETIARAMLARIRECGFELGDFAIEKTLLWQRDGLWFRARPDAILVAETGIVMLDMKTTTDAAPDAIAGSMTEYSYELSHAHYVSGAETLWPEHAGRVAMIYLFAEKEYPYVMTPTVPDGAMAELGQRRYTRAVDRWRDCLASGVWDGYSRTPVQLTPRGWELAKEGM